MGFIRTGKFRNRKLRAEFLSKNGFELERETEKERVFVSKEGRLSENKINDGFILIPNL